MDKPRGSVWVHPVMWLVQLGYGAFPVVGKLTMHTMDPMAVAGWRVLCATPLLFAIAWVLERHVPERRDWPALALLGLMGVALNQGFYIVGLKYATAIDSAILMTSIPIISALFARFMGVERLATIGWVGIAVGVAGAVVMLQPWQALPAAVTDAQRAERLWGDFLLVINCIVYGIYLVLQRPVLARIPPLTLIAWAFLFGGGMLLIPALPAVIAQPYAGLEGGVWRGLAFIILVPTALNYVLNAWAIRESSPSLVAAYVTLQPAVAAVLAVIYLGEVVTLAQGAGFLMIAAGLFWVNTGKDVGPAGGTPTKPSLPVTNPNHSPGNEAAGMDVASSADPARAPSVVTTP